MSETTNITGKTFTHTEKDELKEDEELKEPVATPLPPEPESDDDDEEKDES